MSRFRKHCSVIFQIAPERIRSKVPVREAIHGRISATAINESGAAIGETVFPSPRIST